MAGRRVSAVVDAKVWADLKALARERHQNLSGLLEAAIVAYVARRRVRPEVLDHLEASMQENALLGSLPDR